MDLRNILAISGKPGLYKLISNSTSRVIVESVSEGKKIPVSTTSKISSLEDISIFTYEEDVPLIDVFKKIHEKEAGGKGIDHKSPEKELRNYMEEILEDYDEDRVYTSDLKKMFQWYNLLVENNVLDFDSDEDAEDKKEEEEPTEE